MALATENIRRYLLGDVTDAERERLEMLFNDEEASRDVSIAENELIEEYLEGSLSDEERDLFEGHFMSSGEHRDMVKEIALLKRYSSGPMPAYLTGEHRTSDAGRDRYRPLVAAVAISLAGLVGLLGWRMLYRETPSPLRQQLTTVNAADLGDLSLYPSMTLVPERQMRPAGEPRFATDGPGTSFLFRLPLPAGSTGAYAATFTNSGNEIVSGVPVRVYSDASGSEARLLMPRETIKRGQAEISLTLAGGETLRYPFVAE